MMITDNGLLFWAREQEGQKGEGMIEEIKG